MKRILSFCCLLFILQANSFSQIEIDTARDGGMVSPEVPRFEIGPFLGQPIGLIARWWFNPTNAVDVIGAWSFTENGIFELDASYILNYYYPRINTGTLPLYVGVGGGFRIGDDWFIGVRFPVGAIYLFENFPVSVFAEIDPQWQFLPDNGFVIGGGVGIRVTLGSASK